MRNFLLSRLIVSKPCRKSTQLGFLPQNPFLAFNSFTCKSNPQLREDSFTVSYLIDSCGLSPTAAIQASKFVRLEDPDKPNSVLSFLRNYGFSEIQLSEIVKRRARLLVADPETTLLPKMKFLQSIGLSNTDLPEIIVSNPALLIRSLNECLIPRYRVLKSVLSDNAEVIKVLKIGNWSFSTGANIDGIVMNIKLLREVGVPQRFVTSLVTGYPDVAFFEHAKFVEAVRSALEMGFDPSKSLFISAINALAKLKQPMWESRLKTFERWGWSREVALSAFKKIPNCMLTSEEKIGKVMHFLVNEMGYSSEDIAHFPLVLTLSLEKRIIPRCSVVQTLKSKHLVKNDLRLGGFILLTEKKFFQYFLSRLKDHHNG